MFFSGIVRVTSFSALVLAGFSVGVAVAPLADEGVEAAPSASVQQQQLLYRVASTGELVVSGVDSSRPANTGPSDSPRINPISEAGVQEKKRVERVKEPGSFALLGLGILALLLLRRVSRRR